jgi:hypothetical protein
MKPTEPLTDDQLLQRLARAVSALPDVPPALERSALALFPAAPSPLVEAARSGLRLLTAVLSFDSFAASSVALGMRSLPSTTRHLLYASQGRDIDLRIAPTARAFALAGQVLGPDEAGTIDLVRRDDGAALHARLDTMGEFRIEGVDPGTWVMTLTLGGDRIELPPLEVGPGVGDCRA